MPKANIHACNRSAEALFGYDGEALMQHNLVTLFAPESQHVVIDYLESVKSQDIASLLGPWAARCWAARRRAA